MPVKNPHKTRLKMPSTRISVPRWGSILPGADSVCGRVVSSMSGMGCVERGDPRVVSGQLSTR
jgi:hypothetical protein